MFTDTPELIHY